MIAGRRTAGAAVLALVLALLGACARGPAVPVVARPALVSDVSAARVLLEQQRTAARLASQEPVPRRVQRLTSLGLFDDADSLLAGAPRTFDLVLAEADLRLRQYRFDDARTLLESARAQRPDHRAVRLLDVRLAHAAWQLDHAEEQARALLGRGRRDPEAAVLLGRILLARGDAAAALEWAEVMQRWPTTQAAGHLTAAEAHLLADRLPAAEAEVEQALALDPLNANARFVYGYLLWRRGVPALLTAMQAQWRLALAVDPLHLHTHWHLGNGHTPALISDYVAVADSATRAALAPADSLLLVGDVPGALAHIQAVEGEAPGSVLPALWRGSVHYQRGLPYDPVALDSALAAFRAVIDRVDGFGPAHNGVAAVLKQRQMRALAAWDSLETVLEQTVVPGADLLEVVPELGRSPRERVAQQVTQQLGPFLAYLPLFRRAGLQIHLPPLHHDLAAASGDPAFRTATTFDNRRWMDIRGMGGVRGAAAGIELLERGSHQDRNVLLHEVVHLVHTTLFTDEQRRQVRRLYQEAVREGRALDDYSEGNELEFLAQAVEAFLSPAKAHPLDRKSMNTAAGLQQRDPETFAFVALLVEELERARAGDLGALRSNRAQLYLGLARAARREGEGRVGGTAAAVLLDSALIHDPRYLPAVLEYALLEGERGRPARADEWIAVAEGIDPGAPAVLATRSRLLGLDERGVPGAADTRVTLLRQAADREQDPQERAAYVRERWELEEALARLPEAIATAAAFAADPAGPLPPRRQAQASAELAVLRMRTGAGYAEETVPALRERLAASPFDFDLVGLLADALVAAGQWSEAEEVLTDAYALLTAAGGAHPGVNLRLAERALAGGDSVAALTLVEPLLDAPTDPDIYDGRLARLLISVGQSTEAQRQLTSLPAAREPAQHAELAFTRGWIAAWRGDVVLAERLYREAVATDPYRLEARVALVDLLRSSGRGAEAESVAASAATLPLPLGPDFERRVRGGG